MGDPLFSSGLDLGVFVIVLVKVLVAFAVLLVSVMLMIWFERKVISDMQDRIGPNRAGPFGLLQTLADGTKLFFKEDLIPERADRVVFKLAPYLALIPALLVFTIVPVGGVVTIAHHTVELQVADPPIGILFLLALSSIAVYGTMLAGWSSGSKYPLLGSVRATAQMISYEAAMGLSIIIVILESHSLSTRTIVTSQAVAFWHWNVIRLGVIPFIIFFIASTAELNRPPFDLAEGESELGGGFHTEYSSIRFALFFLAEFMNTITMSAIVVTLFFGGPDGPGFHFVRWLWPILWFLAKTGVFLYVQVWIRAALPRMRYDQLMDLGWKRLIPLSLGWLLVIAGILESRTFGVSMIGVGLLGGLLLAQSIRVARRRREDRLAAGVSDEVQPIIVAGIGSQPTGDTPRTRSELTMVRRRELDFFGGFKISIRQVAEPRITTEYPKVKRPKPPRLHGRHVLNRYEDGMEKCIGCELCAAVCPADCIYVRGADNPIDSPVSPGERYGFVYEINYLRCIHCDMCVEACPTEAITESKLFEFSFTSRADAIYTKSELVVDDEGKPQHLPWEDWRQGEDEHTSGWMRATSPSGSAAYEGEVQWSGELGYGVRPPESGQSGRRDDERTGNISIRRISRDKMPARFGGSVR